MTATPRGSDPPGRRRAYLGETNANLRFDVIGSVEQIERLTAKLARTFDQWEVHATREMETGSPTIIIDSPAFADESVREAFFKRLGELDKRFVGFSSGSRKGNDALEIRMGESTVPLAKREEWNNRYRAVVGKAADDVLGPDGEVGYTFTHQQTIKGKGGVHGEGDLQGGRDPKAGGDPALDDPVVAKARAELERAVEDVRAGRAAADEGKLNASLRQGDDGGRPGVPGSVRTSGPGAGDDYPDAIPRNRRQKLAAAEDWDGQGAFVHGVHATGGFLGDSSVVYVSDRTLTPVETWVHELGHFFQEQNPKVNRALRRHLGDDVENWVQRWLDYVIHAYPQRNLPKVVRNAFDDLSEAMIREAARTGGAVPALNSMRREVAEVFDAAVWYRQLKGGALRAVTEEPGERVGDGVVQASG